MATMIHTRAMFTHTKRLPFFSLASLSRTERQLRALPAARTRKRAERDTSAISRIVWQPNPGRTRLFSPFHLALCFVAIPVPLPQQLPRHSNLLLSLHCIVRAGGHKRNETRIHGPLHETLNTTRAASSHATSLFLSASKRFVRLAERNEREAVRL